MLKQGHKQEFDRYEVHIHFLFWLSAAYNFHLKCRHIPGIRNIAADSASRLHLPGHLETLLPFTAYTPLSYHMSLKSLKYGSTGSPPGRSRHSGVVLELGTSACTHQSQTLMESLDSDVTFYRGHTFAESTNRAYATQELVYFGFCHKMSIVSQSSLQPNMYM